MTRLLAIILLNLAIVGVAALELEHEQVTLFEISQQTY